MASIKDQELENSIKVSDENISQETVNPTVCFDSVVKSALKENTTITNCNFGFASDLAGSNKMDTSEESLEMACNPDSTDTHRYVCEAGSCTKEQSNVDPSSEDIVQNETNMEDEAENENNNLTLDTLPPEIFLHICAFIDAKIVIKTVSLVCKAFYHMLHADATWKVRIGKRWPKKYPAVPVRDADFNWKKACIEREEQYHIWSSFPASVDEYKFNDGIFASVDSVHLMQNGSLLSIGSRDRYLNLLDLRKLEPGNPDSVKASRVWTKMKAHKGWIWSMASQEHILATGSWDTYIKFWDLQAEGTEMHKVKCKSAVLCTHFEEDFLVAGGYDKKVYHVDPRAPGIISEKKYHKQPVLSLVADDNYIITASEDSTIGVYDRRAGDVLKRVQLVEYPMSLSYGQDQLWVGDKVGHLHLLDATDGDFIPVSEYDVGHKGKMTGVIHTLGAIYTCSTDHSVRVLEPNIDPGPIRILDHLKCELAGIDYQNGTLVSACSDASVEIWRPKEI